MLELVTLPKPKHLIMPILAVALMAQSSADAGRSMWQRGPVLAERPTTYALAMKSGDHYAIRAAQFRKLRRKVRARGSARRALAAYAQAIRADPKQGDPHLRSATLLVVLWLKSIKTANHYHTVQAIRHWVAFEKKEPLDPRITEYLFERALRYTTLAQDKYYRLAVKDYTRLMRSTHFYRMGGDRATTMSNLAEIYMMLRDLDKAIPMYVRALNERSERLAAYGLAVALDRDGRGEKARQVMRKFSRYDRTKAGFLKAISKKNVFFVPIGEINYYHALGFEANDRPGDAIIYYQKFINSGAHPRFQLRARENIARLRKQLLKQLKKTPPPFVRSVLRER